MKKLTVLLFLVFAIAVAATGAPAPTLIPFQGRLTDQVGRPYTNGQFTIIFTLYDQSVGGSPLWTETHQRVGVISGMVNVFLGSIQSFNDVGNPQGPVSFSETRHLGINIDADGNPNTPDPEMVPRQMIIPAFWAKQADNSTKLAGRDWSSILLNGSNDPDTGRIDGAKIGNVTLGSLQIGDGQINTRTIANGAVTVEKLSDGSVTSAKIVQGTIQLANLSSNLIRALNPPGTIVAFGGSTPPPGWLLCDGSPQNVNVYLDLFNAIGTAWGSDGPTSFRIPDLRGLFLRGVDGIANRDPDKSATFRLAIGPNGNTGNAIGSLQMDEFKMHIHPSLADGNQTRGWVSSSENSVNHASGAAGGNETRPKNAYVNYIIKY